MLLFCLFSCISSCQKSRRWTLQLKTPCPCSLRVSTKPFIWAPEPSGKLIYNWTKNLFQIIANHTIVQRYTKWLGLFLFWTAQLFCIFKIRQYFCECKENRNPIWTVKSEIVIASLVWKFLFICNIKEVFYSINIETLYYICKMF